MENLAKLVKKIVAETNKEKDKLQQISKFDETLKILGDIEVSDKPTYSFPLTDTLGKQTYSNLNKK